MRHLNYYMEKNKMQTIILDGKYLLEKENAHVYLQEKLNLPEYYGRNLDALYDCLTEFVDIEIHMVIPADVMKEEKNTYFHKVKRVLQAAARENKELKLIIS